MSDAYSNVVGGKLNLKGISKKKKKKKDKEDATEQAAGVASATAAAASTRPTDGGASSSDAGAASYSEAIRESGHTEAEMRRLETMASRQVDKLKRGEVKSHREKVKDFNSYLSNLTEHYDLPKVSKGN
jgi:protein FAM32A